MNCPKLDEKLDNDKSEFKQRCITAHQLVVMNTMAKIVKQNCRHACQHTIRVTKI